MGKRPFQLARFNRQTSNSLSRSNCLPKMKKHNLFLVLLLSFLFASLVIFAITNRISFVQSFIFPDMLLRQQQSLLMLRWDEFLINLLRALTGISIFTLGCFLAGAPFFSWQAISLIKIISAFALGEIIFSLLFLSLITLTGLRPAQTGLIFLLCAVPGLVRVAADGFRRFSLQAISLTALPRLGRHAWLLWLVLLSAWGLTSARLGYDAVSYYFAQPRLMALTGQPLFSYPSNAFVVSSFHPGILFTALIQLFGDQAARMLSWLNGVLILASGWMVGQKVGLSKQAQLYFVTLMLTSTAFVDLLGDGKVELISTAPIVVALWWIVDSLQNPSRGRFLLIGTLFGFAMIARPYNMFLIPVFTALFYLWHVLPRWKRDGLAVALRFARPVLWTFPTLLAMGAFHLWQNYLWLGSPLAPITYARELESADWQWQIDPAMLNTLRLLYPLTVTFINNPQSLGTISPLFVGTLPFLLLPIVRARLHLAAGLKSLFLPALLTLVLWINLFFTVIEIRYVFFLWVVLFLFSSQVIETALRTFQRGYRNILRTSMTLLLLFIAARTISISLVTYSPIDSNGQAHCADIVLCAFLNPLNQEAAKGERVFVMHAYRYYLRPDLFACSSQAYEYAALQTLAKENSGEFWVELYRQGFRYVTYEPNFAKSHIHFASLPSPENAPHWLLVRLLPSTNIGVNRVYEIQPIDPPFLPEKTCSLTPNAGWQVKDQNFLNFGEQETVTRNPLLAPP